MYQSGVVGPVSGFMFLSSEFSVWLSGAADHQSPVASSYSPLHGPGFVPGSGDVAGTHRLSLCPAGVLSPSMGR